MVPSSVEGYRCLMSSKNTKCRPACLIQSWIWRRHPVNQTSDSNLSQPWQREWNVDSFREEWMRSLEDCYPSTAKRKDHSCITSATTAGKPFTCWQIPSSWIRHPHKWKLQPASQHTGHKEYTLTTSVPERHVVNKHKGVSKAVAARLIQNCLLWKG